MAIKYNKQYNDEIRKVVKNFNQTRNRIIKSGVAKSKVPTHLKVSTLKSLARNRKELDRQLKKIKQFSRKELNRYITTDSGQKINKWKKEYLDLYTEQAKEFFNKRKELVEQKIKRGFAGETMRLNNIESKLQTLSLDTALMTESQFKSYESAIKEFMEAPEKMKRGYRGFLSEVDVLLNRVGDFSKDEIDSFFKKFSKLTPDQFQYLYEKADIIDRVYEIVDSPIHGNALKMNTTKDDASNLLNTLLSEVDMLVKDAQENL